MIRRLLSQMRRRNLQRLTSQSAYERWAKDYPPIAHNRLMEIEQLTMIDLMPELSGRCVLDLACGTGRYGLIAQQDNAQSVIGVDDSKAMLLESPLQQCIVGSMSQIPLSTETIDVVLCGLAVGHSPDLGSIIDEISRVLIHGGVALLSDFHPFQYLSGARRTFQSGREIYEVEHYVHLYQVWQSACQSAGLHIDAVVEPTIPNYNMPVVIVYRLVKS